MDSFNVKDLRNYCKLSKLKGYTKLKKSELIYLISVLKIERWYRKIKLRDKYCIISQRKIRFPYWKSKYGTYYYNLDELVNYFKVTGKVDDPLTHETFSKQELNLIKKMCRQYNYNLNINRKKIKLQKDIDEQIDILDDNIRFFILKFSESFIINSDDVLEMKLNFGILYRHDNFRAKHLYEWVKTVPFKNQRIKYYILNNSDYF